MKDTNPSLIENPRKAPRTRYGWVLPVGFITLAAALVLTSRSIDIPLVASIQVDRSALAAGARRIAMSDPPQLMVNGVSQTCNGCHQIFASASAAGAPRSYHDDVHLSHGMNNRCVNCHDPSDREKLTLRDGTTVAFGQTPTLCAQCHGTVYRDWQRGTHGKTLGSWVTHAETQRRLNCNECHDPHSPRYEPYPPLPGPNTLRMRAQHDFEHQTESSAVSPLQRWLHTPSTGAQK